MQKLKNLEVFGVTKVTLKRELGHIKGESGDGDLDVSESDTCFAFYIRTSDLQSGDVPYSALANCLSKILGIDDEHKRLVMDILVTRSHRRLETILEQYGLHCELSQDTGSRNASDASNDYSIDASYTVPATNKVSNKCIEGIPGALLDASQDEDRIIGQSRISVTQAACSFDSDHVKIGRSSMPFYAVSGKGIADHQTGSASPALECRLGPSQRVWDTEELLLALPEPGHGKINGTSSKPPRLSRSDLTAGAHRHPRSEAIWEEDQETGYLGELFVGLNAVNWSG